MKTEWNPVYRKMRKAGRSAVATRIFNVLAATALALTIMPSSARAWWNDEWSLRKKITIDTGQSGASITDPVGAVPVLVRLHLGNFRFGQAKEDGSDLRFVAGDDKAPLKHHIERFDSLLGEALVWVKVPDVKPGAKTDIWLYYGNKKAVAANDAKGTYDSDNVLVYHFTERGTPAQDSSTWANGSQSSGQPAEGAIIGLGLRLDGQHPLVLPASPSLTFPDGTPLTWSTWIKPADLGRNETIFSRRDGANGLVIGIDAGAPFVEVTSGGNVQRSAIAAPIAPGGWHSLAMTATPGLITLYLDGNPYATLSATMPALNSAANVGMDSAPPAPAPAAAPSPDASAASSTPTGDGAAAAPDAAAAAPAADASAPPAAVQPSAYAGFVGDIDELAISKVVRPVGYIKVQAVGQGPDQAKLVVFSVDEETASWLSGYFAVILKSVTIDGWVVISLLMIMAVISWVVMFDKARYLGKQIRANARFQESFRELASDLTVLDQPDAGATTSMGGKLTDADLKLLKDSSLYRIYHIGAEEIRHRFIGNGDGRTRILSAQSIAAIRASLDGGFARETQGLNRLMVLLTIAISGGPFLGLLGTVVGVMITFAAIAQSGDVNVNAIAPGIAAALVATVAGLGVAIPALFGYNYLISKVKDLSTDMQVFIDEFTTKMAEFYDGRSSQPVPPLAAE